MTATTTTKLRILMLPGYTQNASIFSQKLGAIRKGLNGLPLELVFIDPPHVMQLPTTDTSITQFDSAASDDPARAWWFSEASDGRKTYTQYDETIVYLRKVLEEQQPLGIDAVFGFSQGAAMAAILTALVERPHLHPVFAAIDPPIRPFQFSIMVAGLLPLDPRCLALFEGQQPLNTPSLHVLGRGDTIVEDSRSLPLTKMFADARIEWHDGGHHTPSKSSWRNFFKNYFNSFILPSSSTGERLEVASPNGGAGSEPASGASTPVIVKL